MQLYRCDECGKETGTPITIRINDYKGDTLETKHAYVAPTMLSA